MKNAGNKSLPFTLIIFDVKRESSKNKMAAPDRGLVSTNPHSGTWKSRGAGRRPLLNKQTNGGYAIRGAMTSLYGISD